MAKEKVKKEKPVKSSKWKDELTTKGYKLTNDDKTDRLAYYRFFNRTPAWTLKEVNQGFKEKKEEKKAKPKKAKTE